MRKNPSPQLEDGYIKIANEIMDAFCRFRMSGQVRQVVDCIVRKTYGWNKKEDWIAQSQIVEMTGLSKGSVSRELSKAITHNMVIVHDNHLKLNKNYKEWIRFTGKHFNPKPRGIKLSPTITKKVIVHETGVIVDETKVIVHDGNKRHYTKDTTTKDTITLKSNRAIKNRRNPDIDKILSYLQEKLELPRLDLSEKVNRQYAWVLLRKSRKGMEGVLWLIDLAASDAWWRNHITSVRDLWANQIKLVSQKRGDKNAVAII